MPTATLSPNGELGKEFAVLNVRLCRCPCTQLQPYEGLQKCCCQQSVKIGNCSRRVSHSECSCNAMYYDESYGFYSSPLGKTEQRRSSPLVET